MKVSFATGIFPPDIGGPATYVDGLARELFRSGTDVAVVTYGERATEDASPFPITRVSRARSLPVRYVRFFRSFRRSLTSESVAYLQDPVSAGLPATVAALSKRRPTVVKIVGDLAWEIGRERGLVEDSIETFQNRRYPPVVEQLKKAQRYVARRAARVITPSVFLRDLVEGWNVSGAKIEVVQNAVRIPVTDALTREEARRVLGVEGEPLLMTAGRFVPWKGFEILVDAMPEVLSVHRNARLIIVGGGPGEGALRRRIASGGLERSVVLAGSLDANAMSLHLKAADIFVLASTYEGFSHVLLEAMLAGLPIVASRVGGNPELIDDGVSGLLVSPDRDGVTSALLRVAADTKLREHLSRGGHERARRIRWEDMVSRTSQILRRVAEVGPRY